MTYSEIEKEAVEGFERHFYDRRHSTWRFPVDLDELTYYYKKSLRAMAEAIESSVVQ